MKRATAYIGKNTYIRYISIHALVKRATSNVPLEYEYTVISIHALVKRATPKPLKCIVIRPFQSTPS